MARKVDEDSTPCVCGHPREAHEHYRRGSDCALCGAARCKRFRADRRPGSGTAGGRRLSPESN